MATETLSAAVVDTSLSSSSPPPPPPLLATVEDAPSERTTQLSPQADSERPLIEQSEEALFDSVGHVMKSINTWIMNNNGLAARPNQARNMLEKLAVNKKKQQTVDDPIAAINTITTTTTTPAPTASKMPSKKQSSKKRKTAETDGPIADPSDGARVVVVPLPDTASPAKKSKKSSSSVASTGSPTKKRKSPAPSADSAAEVSDAHAAPAFVDSAAECSPTDKKKRKRSSRQPATDAASSPPPAASATTDETAGAANVRPKSPGPPLTPPSTSSAPRKRLLKLQRCCEAKVAQFEIFDNRPPKKRPPVSLLKLGIRAMQPRALLPGESCLIAGNLYCDPAMMHNVDLSVYGDEVSVHVSAAGSLVDREAGGLSVYLVNVSPSFHQINVGDVIGYVQLRSLDGSLKLYVQ